MDAIANTGELEGPPQVLSKRAALRFSKIMPRATLKRAKAAAKAVAAKAISDREWLDQALKDDYDAAKARATHIQKQWARNVKNIVDRTLEADCDAEGRERILSAAYAAALVDITAQPDNPAQTVPDGVA